MPSDIEVAARDGAAERLSRMIQLPTVSAEHETRGDAPFEAFIELLRELYPLVHERLELERVGPLGLLYRWRGAGHEREPLVLMAHFDVVPVDESDDWTHPPFAGIVADGFVFGRGALDDKGPLLVVLEAVENLLAAGFVPAREVYLSFGGNEETFGDAAEAIAQALRQRGIVPWMVIDEGGAVVDAPLPFVRGTAAMVGVGEKGIATLQLSARGDGGHASAPPTRTAVGRIARAVDRLGPTTFRPRTPAGISRMLRLFSERANRPAGLLLRALAAMPPVTARLFARLGGEPAALVRTTIAATMQSGGTAANVLPSQATATLNLRIALGESVASAMRRVTRRIGDREVRVELLEGSEPSAESRTDNAQFALIARSVGASHPEAATVPYVMMAATDSRYFHRFCPVVYRFAPLAMSAELRATIHGVDERVAVSELERGERFHRALLTGLWTVSRVTLRSVAGIVGLLAFVEFTSGILQGYYTPMLTDIARHLHVRDADVNWLEGSQLMLSALIVPALAKLGDMVGHKRILLVSTAVTAAASAVLPFTDSFGVFLAAWALQGFYVVWLPLEIAIIWSRTRGSDGRSVLTTRAAGILVAALELGAILGALGGGALIDVLPLPVVLSVPAVCVVICFFVVRFGVSDVGIPNRGEFDWVGASLVSLALLALTGGFSLLRLQGAGEPLPWVALGLGLLLIVPFALWELRHPDPLIDVRMFRSPALLPIFLTAGLFGMSVLGAQAPLSTFARTDPERYGYGLGASGFGASLLIGFYLIAMITGALLFPKLARRITPRLALVVASTCIGVGYLLFLPFHDGYGQVVANMVVAGLGSGALVAALPAAAASAAPETQTGVATGLTNSVKTVGGALASCVFGIALLHGATGAAADETATAGSLSGYMIVWIVCGASALCSAVLLCFVPRTAFQDRESVAIASE